MSLPTFFSSFYTDCETIGMNINYCLKEYLFPSLKNAHTAPLQDRKMLRFWLRGFSLKLSNMCQKRSECWIR